MRQETHSQSLSQCILGTSPFSAWNKYALDRFLYLLLFRRAPVNVETIADVLRPISDSTSNPCVHRIKLSP